MKFSVRSRQTAKFFRPTTWKAAVISITEPGGPLAEFDYPFKHVLRLQFDDITKRIDGRYAFTSDDAKKILKFMAGVEGKVNEVLVHCEAGISRSAAVAAALSKIYNGDDTEFYGPRYRPNSLIYRVLLDEHFGPIVEKD
jgi:predicted protein tyrosine phosphatase